GDGRAAGCGADPGVLDDLGLARADAVAGRALGQPRLVAVARDEADDRAVLGARVGGQPVEADERAGPEPAHRERLLVVAVAGRVGVRGLEHRQIAVGDARHLEPGAARAEAPSAVRP